MFPAKLDGWEKARAFAAVKVFREYILDDLLGAAALAHKLRF